MIKIMTLFCVTALAVSLAGCPTEPSEENKTLPPPYPRPALEEQLSAEEASSLFSGLTKDKWYIAYHTQTLEKAMKDAGLLPTQLPHPTTGALQADSCYRNSHIDEVTINPDGTIAEISGTMSGVAQVGYFDPYQPTPVTEDFHPLSETRLSLYIFVAIEIRFDSGIHFSTAALSLSTSMGLAR